MPEIPEGTGCNSWHTAAAAKATVFLCLALVFVARPGVMALAQSRPPASRSGISYSPGSDAWIRRRNYELQFRAEFEKTEKRAEKRRAEFVAAEKLSRSDNETKEMAGKRIAEINARLKMKSMLDAGYKKEAQAIALSIADHLSDPDFELVKWWKPVDSKRLIEYAVREQSDKLKDESEKHAGLVSRIAKLKERDRRRNDQDDESTDEDSGLRRLENEASDSLSKGKTLEQRVKSLKAAGSIPIFKICLEFKPSGENADDPPNWTPDVWYFAMTPHFGAFLLQTVEEREIAALEFEKSDKRTK